MKRPQLRDKDFLAELKAFADAQRTLIEAECDGFATDATARDLRATRARSDFRFFCRTSSKAKSDWTYHQAGPYNQEAPQATNTT